MRVQVSANTLKSPHFCVCCGGAAEAVMALSASRSKGVRVVRTQTRTWELPACGACNEHVNLWSRSEAVFVSWATAAIFIGLALMCINPVLGFAVIGIVGGLGFFHRSTLRARSRLSHRPECSSIDAPAKYAGWNGTVHAFDFANERFAAAFMDANLKKLINVSADQKATLSDHLAAKKLASSATDDAAAFQTAVQRIEAGKTPAGRRAALARGLTEVARQEDQARLRLEASRIEVDAALEKADSLKTPSARVRCLQQALDSIRGDDVDDDLQRDQIKWLEDALAAEAKR